MFTNQDLINNGFRKYVYPSLKETNKLATYQLRVRNNTTGKTLYHINVSENDYSAPLYSQLSEEYKKDFRHRYDVQARLHLEDDNFFDITYYINSDSVTVPDIIKFFDTIFSGGALRCVPDPHND